MLSGRVPKIFSRKNSARRAAAARKEEPSPVYIEQPLSPVSEHSVYSEVSDDPPRPVPPPQHYHHDEDRDMDHDMDRDLDPDDLIEPHSRLYETFTASEDDRRATPIPLVVRQELAHDHDRDYERDIDHHPMDDDSVDEHGFVNSHSENPMHDHPVMVAPSSEQSHSTHSSGRGQRVTFIGDLSSHDRGSSSLHRRATTNSRNMDLGDRLHPPLSSSSSSRRYNTYPRREPERAYRPRTMPRDRHYEQQLPYMIFVDYGDGLEIGNEVDGFMPYEEYIATAHLRTPQDNTYFIIPGSTPVIFHDENGHELYRVEAQKYNTPTLRRRRYIIQDEFGNELFRIGNWNRDRANPFIPGPPSDYSSSSGSRSSLSRETNSDEARTEYTESSAPDILVMDENGQRIYDSRDWGRRDYAMMSPRSRFASELIDRDRTIHDSNYMFVDEHGHLGDKKKYYPRGSRSGSSVSGASSDESYKLFPRQSQITYV
ncbi:hypothetical protein EW145_g49 [Phellinidium pouzarii]|uniref:Uncharacterized protein n=1 Tax=Phellinidium pouzarii TaxID=167371 RepID=A0A4S4LJZ6_9AGAM|nr:hypothetical protein EW145_g49 [Phellinidium pouzarii]